jgi:hypothetical protein
MDYRKAWDEVKAKLGESIEEGRDNGYDEGEETYPSGMYDAYKRVLDHMKELESQIPGDIKVGDTVRIVKLGLIYPSYVEWIRKNVTNPLLAARWDRDRRLRHTEIGVVRYVAPHSPGSMATIAYVEIGGGCYMVEINGLEKVEEA